MLTLAPAERPAFLAEACGGDSALRREIGSLLVYAYEDETRGFLNEQALEVAARQVEAPRLRSSALAGRQLGSYKIIAPLGKDGMGEIWLT